MGVKKMRLKNNSISLQNLQPQVVFALQLVGPVYEGAIESNEEGVITSVNDNIHSVASLHNSGNAVDLRIRDPYTGILYFSDPAYVVEEMQVKLNSDFDVILEKDHIHLEYQPKRKDY
jgi:hypothetical protein